MIELLHTLEPEHGSGGGDVLWGSEKKTVQLSKVVGETLKSKSESRRMLEVLLEEGKHAKAESK